MLGDARTRGELERLVDAEGLGLLAAPRHREELEAHGGVPPPDAAARLGAADWRQGDRHDRRRGREEDRDDDPDDPRRGGRRGFLAELIEGFGDQDPG